MKKPEERHRDDPAWWLNRFNELTKKGNKIRKKSLMLLAQASQMCERSHALMSAWNQEAEETEQALSRLGDASVAELIAPLREQRKAFTDALFEDLKNWRPLSLEGLEEPKRKP